MYTYMKLNVLVGEEHNKQSCDLKRLSSHERLREFAVAASSPSRKSWIDLPALLMTSRSVVSRKLCSLYYRVSRCNFKSHLTKFRSAATIPDEAEYRQARNSLHRNLRPLVTAVKLLFAHPLLFYLSAWRSNWRLARGTFNKRNVL
jgi:hypothetical protein